MTEKEKMFSGEWHDANFDSVLLEERRSAELLYSTLRKSHKIFPHHYTINF